MHNVDRNPHSLNREDLIANYVRLTGTISFFRPV